MQFLLLFGTNHETMSGAKFKIESGVQLLARLNKKPDLENFYPAIFQSGPKNGEVVEVFSDTSCSSHFLIDIVAETLITSKNSGATAGVLIFNTDGVIIYEDLIEVLKKKISMLNHNGIDTHTLENELKDIMANFFVVDIFSVTQLYTTIYNLENVLIENSNISLLIFNTLTAFYWSEQGFKITRKDLYLKNLINTIQKVTKDYKTICLYTRPEYFCSIIDVKPGEINYQIQILENSKENYQVNVKSTCYKATKFCKIVEKELKWL